MTERIYRIPFLLRLTGKKKKFLKFCCDFCAVVLAQLCKQHFPHPPPRADGVASAVCHAGAAAEDKGQHV